VFRMIDWQLTGMVLGLLVLGFAIVPRTGAAQQQSPIRHVVVFKYSESATEEQIQRVTDEFRSLKDRIPGILAFEHGVNDSPEGHDQGFTHVYLMTFENAAARDTYLPHPEHEKFGEFLRGLGILEGVFVVDYAPME
jgi:hypothetical protein